MTMTAIQNQTFDRLTEANGWRCMCDNGAGRSKCSKTHGTARCPHTGTLVLVMEPNGTMAVVCTPCKASRTSTANATVRKAKTARAKAYAEAQTSIFDLGDEEAGA